MINQIDCDTYAEGKDYTYENGVYLVTSPHTSMTYTGVAGGETCRFTNMMAPDNKLVGAGYSDAYTGQAYDDGFYAMSGDYYRLDDVNPPNVLNVAAIHLDAKTYTVDEYHGLIHGR